VVNVVVVCVVVFSHEVLLGHDEDRGAMTGCI